MAEEIWKVCTRSSNYAISNHGRVKRIVRASGTWVGRIVKPSKTIMYEYVRLVPKINQYVHRLVLETFVGPCPEGMECCHKDGNPVNNHLDNLEWGTHHVNITDRTHHGKVRRGIEHPCSKLTEEEVREIRTSPKPQEALGLQYGVSGRAIWNIKNHKSWSHIK